MADDLRAPRGMHDLLPEDAALWAHIRDTAEAVAHRFGYRPIATPIVEDAKVFLRTAGEDSDIVQKEVYLFEDRGNDRLALRPEGTAGVCRAYLEHGMGSWPQPVRLFYFGPFFRYDRPQAGRYRQLWQFGAEAIGSDSPALDAELIDLQATIYREVGLTNIVPRINSIGTAATRARYVEALRAHFAPHVTTLSRDSQRRYETNIRRVLDSKEDAAHPAVAGAPSILDFLDDSDREHFEAVKAHLDALGIAYEVDPRIVRGLDYYSRTVWEFEPRDAAGSQGAVGAGGRYDGLIELLGGPHTPAVGFGAGVDRIALNMKAQGVLPPLSAIDIYLVVPDPAYFGRALAIADQIRASGAAVIVGDASRSASAQRRHATQVGARQWAWIGKNEVDSGRVTPRDLIQGEDFEEGLPVDGDAIAAETGWRRIIRALYEYYGPEANGLSGTELVEKALSDERLEGLAYQIRASRRWRNEVVHGRVTLSAEKWWLSHTYEEVLVRELRLRPRPSNPPR